MLHVLPIVPFELSQPELARRAQVQEEDLEAFGHLVEQARRIARPKILYREALITSLGSDTVTIENQTFTSRVLRRNLGEVHRVFAFVVTCGMELDAANPPADDFLADFWWDQIKAAVLGGAIHHLCEHLEKHHRLDRSAMMNPGSGDAHVWPIQQQRPLFDLLGGVTPQIGVELADTFLMRPDKTISGIRFATQKDFRTCQVCHRDPCPSRSAPFDPKFWETMQCDEFGVR